MPKKPRIDPFAEIERNQARLRENIAESKLLVEQTRKLLKQKGEPPAGG
ncbi:MAG: hypothetical protein JWO81_2320 [Alphaproteobacteria bacterium]|nr:hypothetical protein [Alphaproteobacteria bacterium]